MFRARQKREIQWEILHSRQAGEQVRNGEGEETDLQPSLSYLSYENRVGIEQPSGRTAYETPQAATGRASGSPDLILVNPVPLSPLGDNILLRFLEGFEDPFAFDEIAGLAGRDQIIHAP